MVQDKGGRADIEDDLEVIDLMDCLVDMSEDALDFS